MLVKVEIKRRGWAGARWTDSIIAMMGAQLEDLKEQVGYRSSWGESMLLPPRFATNLMAIIINQNNKKVIKGSNTFNYTFFIKLRKFSICYFNTASFISQNCICIVLFYTNVPSLSRNYNCYIKRPLKLTWWG